MSTVLARIAGGRPWRLWAGLASAIVLGGVAGGLIVATTRDSGPSQACSATRVADKALPTVVTINVRGETGAGNGSGEIIRGSGEILTNNHVIAAAAAGGSIEVLFNDGVTSPATLVGRDPLTDLAVIKATAQHGHPVIRLGTSKGVQVGQQVVALGAPLGLSSTATSGIVSALDRTVQVPAGDGKTALLVSAIQTDAAINPGNSGGALVDCAAELVGVPTAGATALSPTGQPSAGNIGLGFAIPVDLAKAVSDEIIATGQVTHSYFGIQVVALPPKAADEAGVSAGLYVPRVEPGGPAERAGLPAGDVITSIDGQPATDPTQLAAIELTKRPGASVSIGYERAGRASTTTVVLGQQP